MSNTPVQEPPAQELSSGSVHTLPPRPLQPTSDPSASKRVCFYKSGDYKFSGHRMVINARTFKTFDALLDALSKKVPLPFGVRTVTTPRGTHLIRALDDLHDGGSYVCSDQKRVKPLNLDEVNRRQVPWNTTRPHSVGRRRRQGSLFGQFSRRNETNRPAKVTERVAVRTPKRLVVIKNRDPTVKRTIVLQRRTAPTFDALLDYLSQILQFPVLKLFSTEGRRVDGLAGLILCSGVVVAAGNEPFRLANYSFQGTGQMAQVMYMDTVEPSTLQPRTQNNRSLSSGRGSRNFSLSSERYIVNQINKSRNGSTNGHLHHHNTSFETEVNHRPTSVETRGTGRVDNEHLSCIVPQDDDIEKSFRVNQDGSMTVEMKVRLTIKEEEMLHWTTTLSRSSLRKGTVCASISESGNSSPDSNNAIAKDSSSISEDETKEENHPAGAGKCVGFNNERAYEGYASTVLGKAKTGFKRTPTPGPRHVVKKASIESVKKVTESGVQENTLGHYSYMEKTADGEMTEGYCVVRQSSSSNRPIPKPRKTASAGASNKGSHSSIRSSGVAEVLQIQNNGMEVTETVMHIYESQGCYDNYFANEEYSTDGLPLQGSTPAAESRPSTDSRCRSSSNDCDIDFSRQPPTADSLQRQKEEMLSLSSEPITPTREITATNSQTQETVKKDKTLKSETKKKMNKPARNQKGSTSTSSSDKKQKESIVTPPKSSKRSSTDKLSSNASVGKKTLSSSESGNGGRKSRGAEKPQIKKTSKDEKALLASTENVRRTPPKRQNITKAAARDNGHNVNTPTVRLEMKKNMSDILQPKKSHLSGKKTVSKPKSMTENRTPSPKKSSELTESFSMPSLNPSPSEIHQYVENWLEKVNPDPVPYLEEAITDESEPQTKVVFQIGGDTESDEKTESQSHPDEDYPSPADGIKKSASCLSVPHCHEPMTLLPNDQYMRGLCVSMPSVRVDPVYEENRLRPHKSAEAIGPADNQSSSSASNVLESRAKIKPVLRELYSSIHCIRSVCETNQTSNLEKSNSLPDFSAQVASVFGSSCKAFMSFLSVMTLRDNLSGSASGLSNQSRSPSEAMLMLESLQKISAIEDEEELRASLTDLQSRASSQFRERWKDFQIMRERLESEPLSPRVSETEFALDVFSEGGDAFEDIDELMDELNMPEDLRAEISSTIQQAKSFYPVEESTFVETEVNQSDTEEDVEKFVEECNNEVKQSPEPDTTCTAEDITTNNGEVDNLEKMQSVNFEQAKMPNESEQEPERESEISQTEKDEPLIDKEIEKERKEEEEQEEEDREGVNDGEDGDTKQVDDSGEIEETETGKRGREAEEGAATEVDDKGQEKSEMAKGSVEEEEEQSVQEVREGTEEEKLEEAEKGLMDEEVQEARKDDSIEETNERVGFEETEEEEEREDEVSKEEEGEGRQEEEIEEADGVNEESDEGEEVGNIEVIEKEKEGADEVIGEKSEEEEVENISEEREEEREEAGEVIGGTDEGEEVGSIEEVEEEREEADEVIGEKSEEEEVGNTEEVEAEEEEADEGTKEKDEGEEVGSIKEVGEEEEEADEVSGEKDEGEEVGSIEEVEGEEGEEEEEADEVTGEKDEGEEVGSIEEMEEEEEVEADEVTGEKDEGEEVGSTEEVEEEEGEEEEKEEADEVTGEKDEGEEVGSIEEMEEEEEVEADEVTGEKDEGEEVGSIEEVEEEEGEEEEEKEEEEEADEVTGEKDEGEEVGNIEEVEEEEEEEEADEVIGVEDEGEEDGNIEEAEEGEEKEEEEEADDEDVEEEAGEGIELIEENSEEEEMKEVVEEIDEGNEVIEETEEEEETGMVTERDVEEVIEEKDEENEEAEEEDEEEDKMEVASEENNDEEEEQEQEVEEDGEDVEVVNIKERGTTDEEEEEEDIDNNVEEEEKCSEGEESGKELEKGETSLEEESEEEREVVEEIEIKENMTAGEMLEEDVGEDEEDNESNELNEGLDEEQEQELKDEIEQENATDDADSISGGTDCKNMLEEASYLQQQSSEEANGDTKVAEHNAESSTKSSEGQCEDDKGNGTDTVNELDTEEGGEPHEGGSSNLPHPVEISQELLDFVNSALQSSSLIFTYDPQGNIRIEPDKARVTQTKQTVIPQSKKDASYGLKRLPSPSTSDLSDYRPETSESGGYKTQDSVDIVTESGEEASPVCQRRTDISKRRTNVERINSNLSVASNSEVLQNSRLKSGGSFSSFDSGTKASKEDLSYFSAASSQKADTEPVREATGRISFSPEKELADGVLIDQGRWLLKENHLIRKSPPVSLGMYGQLDSTSLDTGQENSGEDSPSHCKTQHNPLAAISSSELEEMAKPQTPKCTYYNMPHGSDSDPFLDDSSVKSGKKDASSVKGRGVRVSPTIDTTKTWASKNGSMSSFASVEFKIPDRKVHPEGEPSAVTRARRTSSGAGGVLQAQDSLDTLHVRCGQYCPIL